MADHKAAPPLTAAPEPVDMERQSSQLEVEKDERVHTIYKNRGYRLMTEAPYFPKPPKPLKGEEAQGGGDRSYLETITETVVNPVDVDGHYGCTDVELLPLPFKAPKLWEYFVDVLAGIFTVAQATVVMFISIMVDNDYRAVRFGDTYSSVWLPIARAVIVLYPLCTLLILCTLFHEYACRKFMYYRLLSMRVLVDWHNPVVWKSWFFFYFIATWVLLNAWCLYGVVKFWDFDGEHNGADTVSFTTWIVVNLQTMQILLAYLRLLSSESRLVSLNQVFEQDPVEAQHMLQFTYVIEEHDLMEECRIYGKITEQLMFKRLIHILTCCCAYKNILELSDANPAAFELERLKRKSPNFTRVEGEVDELKREYFASKRLSRRMAASSKKMDPSAASPSKPVGTRFAEEVKVIIKEEDGDGATTSSNGATGGTGSETAKGGSETARKGGPGPVGEAQEDEEVAALKAGGGVNGAGVDGMEAAPREGVKPAPTSVGAGPSAAGTGTGAGAPGNEGLADLAGVQKKGLFRRLMHRLHTAIYGRLYASIHCFYVALIPGTKSWPYRPDVPCFRALIIMEMITYLCVGGIVAFGILRATSSSRCNDGNKVCQSCDLFIQQFGGSTGLCYNSTDYSITRNLPYPPPSLFGL